jgi:diguanylate cyclase (GGDEF)-like protein
MLQARDSGQATITGKLKLASEPNQSPVFGFLVYIPLFQKGLPTDTIEQRRGALRGFINSPFRMDDLLKGARGQNAVKIKMKIYDGTAAVPDALMYDEREISPSPGDPVEDSVDTVMLQSGSMVIHGHPWTLVYAIPIDLEGRENVSQVLATGLIISVLLSILTLVLVDRVRLIRRSEKHYFRLANFDSLTQLPNRAMFTDRLERNLLQTDRDGLALALLFIDVDHFKEINDSRGHPVGDALLQEVAMRLQACVRKVDTVARLGGDEFTVILYDLQAVEDAGNVAQNILSKLQEPCQLQGEPYVISASVGIALYPADATKASDLLKNADQAMYQAKRQGRCRLAFFSAAT